MKWLTKVKQCFTKPKSRVIQPEDVPSPDPIVRESVARAFNSGKMVIGHYDDEGKAVYEERDIKPDSSK